MVALIEYLVGIIFILLLAIFAFKRYALTEGGTLAAIVIGLLVFLFPVAPLNGRIWFALLTLMFLSSFFVSKISSREKEEVNREFAKGTNRDFMQVFANGAGAAFIAVIYHFYPDPAAFVAFATVLATVNADTWATELGILSRDKPFLITSFKRVQKGISGAVSRFGLLAAFCGALFIALATISLILIDSVYFGSAAVVPGGAALFIGLVVILGTIGSLIDSVLGATVQIMYYCKHCQRETEKAPHHCGKKTIYQKGIKFFDNDVVNLVSSLIAGIASFFLYALLV